jgi:predicted nucleic-acid-binding protein
MIGLDTNVLARYFVRDDAAQHQRAARLIERECRPDAPGRIALVTLCELVWVLTAGYGYARKDVARLLQGILTAADLEVEQAPLAWDAWRLYQAGKGDFADYLISLAHRKAGAAAVYSFDRKAVAEQVFKAVP